MTASDEEFVIGRDRIAPGEYKIFAWEMVPANAWENQGFMAAFEGLGRVVSVNAGDVGNVTINLIRENQR